MTPEVAKALKYADGVTAHDHLVPAVVVLAVALRETQAKLEAAEQRVKDYEAAYSHMGYDEEVKRLEKSLALSIEREGRLREALEGIKTECYERKEWAKVVDLAARVLSPRPSEETKR